MDKPGKNITIKINGKDPIIKKEQSIKKEEQHSHVDPDLLTELKSHGKEASAAQESVEESFDWILPENKGSNEIKEYKIESYSQKKKQNLNQSIKKKLGRNKQVLTTIFFTVFFAVLLGTSFGVMILKLVTTEQTPTEQVAGPATPSSGEEKPDDAKAGEKVSIKVGPILTNVVQHGLFSTQDAADSVATGLQDKGIQAKTVELNGQFLVWVGVADNIDGAKTLGNQLKSNDIEVFSKPIELPGKTIEGVTQQEANLLETIPTLFSQLSDAASKGIISGKPANEVISSIIQSGESFKKVSNEEITNDQVKLLHKTISASVTKVEEYKKSGDMKQLENLQRDLLTILSVYQAL